MAATVAGALLLAAPPAGCGSSSSSKVAVEQTCQQVAAVLSDGPDPTADPVGYAEAQVLPLRQIHTSQKTLHDAIDRLAAAYQTFSSTDGRKAKVTVTAAANAVNAICPGAAQ